MAQNTQIRAVLTGDLVKSTDMGAKKIATAFGVLENCARLQKSWTGASLNFTRHRGDGWQVILAQPQLALRSALAFRAALRAKDIAFDSYIGIAVGELATEPAKDLNRETAELFTMSGKALDTLEDLKATTTQLRMAYHGLGAMDAAIILADHLFQQWTQAQAQAMVMALAPDEPITFTEIAKRLGKSRQAVTKAMNSAGFDHLILALETIDRPVQP